MTRTGSHVGRALFFGGLSLEALYIWMARLGDLRQHADRFLWMFAAACGIYLAFVWLVRRVTQRTRETSRWLLPAILLGSVVFRVTLVGLTPTLSDDLYRYLWDGRVQQAGMNPYQYAPSDAALASLRTPEWARINHPDIPTIYPPLMEAMFRLGARLAPTVRMQKFVFLGCDVAVILLLMWGLPRWGINPLMSVIYAWHPLVIVEVAASGHNDPFGVLWLMSGLLLWQGRRRFGATIAFALSFLSKFTTLLLWPFYLVRARRWFAVFVTVVALGMLWCARSPHFAPGHGHYSRPWEFNSSVYTLLEAWSGNPLLTRISCGVGVVCVGLFLAWRSDNLLAYTFGMIESAMIVTPVLEPWYLLWLIPLLCIRFSWRWLVFSGLVMLSYTVLVEFVHHGVWRIPLWARWVEYGTLYGWLLVEMWRWTLNRRRKPVGPRPIGLAV